ncbi:hypothetical protein L596_010997 [Steinernema carpocapsae]|uniref:CUB domain-containing protein n=1 Tax=Steinernema carpocapsae TaxID=34508 RepID=A0A4U5NSU9_STECR|nr:hypothetical protein L596_010997 [Steinernema carpocapsae]
MKRTFGDHMTVGKRSSAFSLQNRLSTKRNRRRAWRHSNEQRCKHSHRHVGSQQFSDFSWCFPRLGPHSKQRRRSEMRVYEQDCALDETERLQGNNESDYPRPYCPKLECIWRLVAPDNTSSIHFFTDNLDLRPNEDFIYFYEGDFSTELRTSMSHTGPATLPITPKPFFSCSEGSICQFKSRGQKATVRFVSGDGFPQNYGFQGTAALYDRTARPQSSLSSVIFLVAAGFLVLLVAILIAYFTCCRGSRYDKTSRPSETTKEEALAEEKLLQ